MDLGARAVSPEALPNGWTCPAGQFLEGLAGVAPDFDSWRATEEAHLSRLMADLLQAAADRAEADRRFDAAAGFLTQGLARDPLSGSVLWRLMRIRMARKRPDIALRLYAEMESRLQAEFGTMPEAETRDLARDIRARRQAPSAEMRPAPNLQEGPRSASDPGRPALPDRPSIAVLPFKNLSDDAEQAYFADGVTEDIITELSRFRNLLVIARNSSFAFRRQTATLAQIADSLQVRFVLQGTLRRSERQVMVTARLIDSESGEHLWSDRDKRDIGDIFLLQEEFTRSVVGALAPQIELAEIARAQHVPRMRFRPVILRSGPRRPSTTRSDRAARICTSGHSGWPGSRSNAIRP